MRALSTLGFLAGALSLWASANGASAERVEACIHKNEFYERYDPVTHSTVRGHLCKPTKDGDLPLFKPCEPKDAAIVQVKKVTGPIAATCTGEPATQYAFRIIEKAAGGYLISHGTPGNEKRTLVPFSAWNRELQSMGVPAEVASSVGPGDYVATTTAGLYEALAAEAGGHRDKLSVLEMQRSFTACTGAEKRLVRVGDTKAESGQACSRSLDAIKNGIKIVDVDAQKEAVELLQAGDKGPVRSVVRAAELIKRLEPLGIPADVAKSLKPGDLIVSEEPKFTRWIATTAATKEAPALQPAPRAP